MQITISWKHLPEADDSGFAVLRECRVPSQGLEQVDAATEPLGDLAPSSPEWRRSLLLVLLLHYENRQPH